MGAPRAQGNWACVWRAELSSQWAGIYSPKQVPCPLSHLIQMHLAAAEAQPLNEDQGSLHRGCRSRWVSFPQPQLTAWMNHSAGVDVPWCGRGVGCPNNTMVRAWGGVQGIFHMVWAWGGSTQAACLYSLDGCVLVASTSLNPVMHVHTASATLNPLQALE